MVTSNGGGTGAGTLRAAITTANGNGEDDTITFTVNGLIPIGGTLRYTASDDLTIIGNGEANTVIDGGNARQVFDFEGSLGNIRIEQLTIQNGNNSGSPGSPGGGGIGYTNTAASGVSFTLSHVLVANCTAKRNGGGIAIDSVGILANSVLLEHVTVTGCTAGEEGGGITVGVRDLGTVNFIMRDSTVNNNSSNAGADGGGMYTEDGTYLYERCTFASNQSADQGSGLYARGDAGATI
ncbi:MAG: hypothetical protein AAF492_01030, partial [Verrucomicrobiota bacterium]